MFDQLLLLSEGRTIFFGPASEAVDYFSQRNFQCPLEFNPADFFIDFLTIDNRSTLLASASKLRIKQLAESYLVGKKIPASVPRHVDSTGSSSSVNKLHPGTLPRGLIIAATVDSSNQDQSSDDVDDLTLRIKDLEDELSRPLHVGNKMALPIISAESVHGGDVNAVLADVGPYQSSRNRKYATSFMRQFQLLLQRSWRTMTREKAANGAMLGQTILFGILLGMIWLHQGRSYAVGQDIQAIVGVMFFMLVNQSFSCQFGILFGFPNEAPVVFKVDSLYNSCFVIFFAILCVCMHTNFIGL